MKLDPRKVVVAISGGVDSSVAAALLRRDFDVTALHFTKFELRGLCREVRARDENNLESAREVAAILGLPLTVVEAGDRFDALVDFFCEEYNAGRTPNPCVLCNATIKWEVLLGAADAHGACFAATGHYARLEKRGAFFRLLKSDGARKDQTYFLHRLTQRMLSRTVFPLSGLDKTAVREIAREHGLPTPARRESQEICFVPAAGYSHLLKERTPRRLQAGEVVDLDGRVLGRHGGYQLFTIGQRKGLGIALGRPAYVVDIDPRTGRVTLGGGEDLATGGLDVRGVNWIEGRPPAGAFNALVKIRYNHRGAEALVTPDGRRAHVEFAEPVRAATPGQAAVFYEGEAVLGGGWIVNPRQQLTTEAEFA